MATHPNDNDNFQPDSNEYGEKPNMTYAQLVSEALCFASGALELPEIYEAISSRHPYYSEWKQNWQRKIRYQLYENEIFVQSDKEQRWKIEENMLKNKAGLWKSVDSWIFKTEAENFIHIENTSKTKVLGATSDDKVIQEVFVDGKADQIWKKTKADTEGYVTLQKQFEPKVITAISESGLELKDRVRSYSVLKQEKNQDQLMNYLKKNKPLIYNQCKTSLGYLNNKKNFAMSEGKPEMTYVQLISEALSNAPGGRLKKEEIYEAISSKHPYYKSENSKGKGPNWQRKIRLKLDDNKIFVKSDESFYEQIQSVLEYI